MKRLSETTRVDHKFSGVYLLEGTGSKGAVEKFGAKHGLAVFVLDGKKALGKEEFLEHIAKALHFPDYFGNNWDAFEDCLTDMSWQEAKGYIMLYQDFGVFAERSPEQFGVALEIFKDSAEFWRTHKKLFLILLHGTGPKDMDLPSLQL